MRHGILFLFVLLSVLVSASDSSSGSPIFFLLWCVFFVVFFLFFPLVDYFSVQFSLLCLFVSDQIISVFLSELKRLMRWRRNFSIAFFFCDNSFHVIFHFFLVYFFHLFHFHGCSLFCCNLRRLFFFSFFYVWSLW